MQIHPLGDRSVLLEIDGGIDTDTLARIRTITAQIDNARIDGITDIVPGYTSVAVHFEPLTIDGRAIRAALGAAVNASSERLTVAEPRTVEVAVAYGREAGPDLEMLAALHGMTPDEVVALHAGTTYTVHLIGFVPGFPYLGGLDPRLATPRRDTPRTAVPAGSVAIGGSQTGIYPVVSPGGWHLIGRTTLNLFDARRDEPALLRVGDHVRFVPTDTP